MGEQFDAIETIADLGSGSPAAGKSANWNFSEKLGGNGQSWPMHFSLLA